MADRNQPLGYNEEKNVFSQASDTLGMLDKLHRGKIENQVNRTSNLEDIPNNAPEKPKKVPQVYDDSNESNLKATATSTIVSKGENDQKVNRIEIKILEGSLNFVPSTDSIKLHAGDTVSLQGFGPYLSRKYYVKSVERHVGSNGYSHSATVMCPSFNDRLKGSSTTGNETAPATQKSRIVAEEQASQVPDRIHVVEKGDTLWSIAKKVYGAGSEWERIYNANSGQLETPNMVQVGQVLILP